MLKKVDRGLMRISQISKFKCQNHNRLALNLKGVIALLFQRIFSVVSALPSGFTLIEVVIAMSILTFLMASVWSASSIRESDFGVMINQEKLRLLATRAKSLTINSVFRADNPACGYGIRIEERSAFIFLNRGACDNNTYRYDSGLDERLLGSVDVITLTGGMIFALPNATPVDVVFIPPYSGAAINGSTTTPSEVDITVRSPANISRRVIINNQGLINARN